MFIHEMTDSECRTALRRLSVGRLGCAFDNQPYVVPVSFVFDGQHLYGFTTVGQKVEWMRANPKVCLEVDDRTNSEQWMSVIVFGAYEELLDETRYGVARAKARQLLQQRRPLWWEPAYMSKTERAGEHSVEPVFYRIHIVRMTGHRAMPDVPEVPIPPLVEKERWVDSISRHIGMQN